ncbi:MAG: tRNA preQ1(34) S-adenosylmethionine ribosyltransferase-isomerase QueA, partial [Deltaproteobacteria bacterium]|nr:tRNA preQ1(34) S-adenosylmethionine ribosyltransferase-isomerase QueA [Deltaproteobacteria bacterium]
MLADLDYELPEDLIAQAPLPERDGARLLVFRRGQEHLEHRAVRDLAGLVDEALFVLNDTRVIRARLRGFKPSGGKAELLLLERAGLAEAGPVERWRALGRANKRLDAGARIEIAGGAIVAEVIERREGGELLVDLTTEAGVHAALETHGEIPLPPYIRRSPGEDDLSRYQTVFARTPGAVAAPTAGLHLSQDMLRGLETAGHRVAHVTLHVGPGTFLPVKVDRLRDHVMHSERYEVSPETAEAIALAKREGRPVVAVGTTVVRTLEAVAQEYGEVVASSGPTDLFIRPPYDFRVIDALFTNFHLPRSTLLALVMAFGGVAQVRAAYAAAI